MNRMSLHPYLSYTRDIGITEILHHRYLFWNLFAYPIICWILSESLHSRRIPINCYLHVVCCRYGYQVTQNSSLYSCGGADKWADVTSTHIFCPAGKYCPTPVEARNCSTGLDFHAWKPSDSIVEPQIWYSLLHYCSFQFWYDHYESEKIPITIRCTMLWIHLDVVRLYTCPIYVFVNIFS